MIYEGEFLSISNDISYDTDKITKYFIWRPENNNETVFDLRALSGFPQIGDTLSENSSYQLENINISKKVDDTNTGVKKNPFVVTCTYDTTANIIRRSQKNEKEQRNKYIDEDGHVVNGSTKPWKMKPTWGWQPVTVEVPFTKAYNSNNQKVKDVINSAGKRIIASTTKYRYEITWSKSYNERKSFFNLYEPFVNNATWVPLTIPGKSFPAGTVLILPPGFTVAYFENRDQQNKPTTYDPYYTYSVKLIFDSEGWIKKLLNQGTYAKFNGGPAEQIYSFQVKSGNTWGALDFNSKAAVASAQKTSGAENVSFDKQTEPLPLNNDGSIFRAAITDPEHNPYNELSFIQYKSMDFSTLPI